MSSIKNTNNINKMKDFITKLISNPCFSNETLLMIEENIFLFFVQNYTALRTTLTSQEFFPDLPWHNIENLYIKILQEEINKRIIPQIQIMIFKKIDYNFVNIILNRNIDQNNFAEQIFKFCLTLLNRFEIRKFFDSVYKIINYNLIDKYIQEIFAKRSYIAFELEKVEKLKFSPELIASYIKFEIIISLASFIREDIDDLPIQQKMNLTDIKFGNSAMQKNHYERIIKQFIPDLTYFPQELILNAMKTHLSFIEDNTIPASCRLAKIFFLFGRNFKPNFKIDKGAENQEKSWFALQKKNYKYYGLDIQMVEELYRISAEDYW